jgi:hypothetical protein
MKKTLLSNNKIKLMKNRTIAWMIKSKKNIKTRTVEIKVLKIRIKLIKTKIKIKILIILNKKMMIKHNCKIRLIKRIMN